MRARKVTAQPTDNNSAQMRVLES